VTSIEDIKGTSGMILPATEIRVMDVETGEFIDPSHSGEILIRGPQVMQGYYHDPLATQETLRSDGFMHTGDIGWVDEKGRLVLTDRKKELIKFKGFQVPPAELEAVLITMKEIKDAIVIPVPDEEGGEVPRAYVVLQDDALAATSDGGGVTEQQIVDYVYDRVAPHKRLRGGVRFTTLIPRSPAGKLLRRVQIQQDREATTTAGSIKMAK
jgi:4-coumarate--CoA ligase